MCVVYLTLILHEIISKLLILQIKMLILYKFSFLSAKEQEKPKKSHFCHQSDSNKLWLFYEFIVSESELIRSYRNGGRGLYLSINLDTINTMSALI